ATVTAGKILELARQAEFLYKTQDPAEQRRLLETVLSNCTFDRGTLCPTYSSPFDLLVRGNETGNWRRGWDSTRPIRASPTATSVSGEVLSFQRFTIFGRSPALSLFCAEPPISDVRCHSIVSLVWSICLKR